MEEVEVFEVGIGVATMEPWRRRRATAGQQAYGSGPRWGRSRQKRPHDPTRDGSLSGTCQGPPWATYRRSDPRTESDGQPEMSWEANGVFSVEEGHATLVVQGVGLRLEVY